MVATRTEPASSEAAFLPLGAHLVGSLPLASAEAVFRLVAGELGGRVRRIPDGETGPRADWIVWQYPVLSARPEFEVAPPTPRSYRALPRLRVREGEDASALDFGSLGYADAAAASYAAFAVLKRDGVVPRACRFQVSLPTPLAPVSAFVALEDQAAVEPAYEHAMLLELERILDAVPHDQLAVQWDTNLELGMLGEDVPAPFDDVAEEILRRLLRIGAAIPPEVELGYHFCSGHDEGAPRHVPADLGGTVQLANALAAGLARSLDWLHLPLAAAPDDAAFVAPLARLRVQPGTEVYLGLLHPEEREAEARTRIEVAHGALETFGVATPCGWGRLAPRLVPELVARHVRLSRAVADPVAERGPLFAWPPGFPRIPEEDWVARPPDAFGLHYDTVENHGWYRNLDLTVEQLARDLRDGEVLIDYSGGTGILLERLRLRVFDRQVGMAIVDSSPKFLRVALDRFRADERVAFRRLRYLRDARRLQYVDEALGDAFPGADHLVSTNAIHLYDDLDGTLRGWSRVLRPGARVRINSGNIRNPRAGENEWIIDETVYVVHEVATGLVRTDERWAAYRPVLDDAERMRAYLDWRDRVFLAPRPLAFYLDALRGGGFAIEDVAERTIEADVEEWYAFLAAYADAVLGWVGGSAKVDGAPADEDAARDRLSLLHRALTTIFGGRPTFRCCWTYITATRT
ncbi:MAG: class I SAM-dependent methyltransferase [Pseudomonadota bacterium]